MNLIKLTVSYIKQNKLSSFLNLLLLTLGIATINILLLFSYQLENNLSKNSEGINVVVGSKGSPIQLILSTVFHMDVPTGNISMSEAQTVLEMPDVAKAIPLALGDSYKGFRIVGTTKAYAEHYKAKLQEGSYWSGNFEVVAGSEVAKNEGLKIGDRIISSHGVQEGGQIHEENPLTLVGILRKTNTVVDRLMLTSVPTVWEVHNHNDEEHEHEKEHEKDEDHEHEKEHEKDDSHEEEHHSHHESEQKESRQEYSDLKQENITDTERYFPFMKKENMDQELTAMFISYSSPLAATSFPRQINRNTDMLAAAPGFEIARLLSLLGIGLDAIRIFGFVLLFAAGLGVFITLYNALKERKHDLAMMRTMGGSRVTIMNVLLLEGLILTTGGVVLGVALGHTAVAILGELFYQARQFELTGWIWLPSELWLFLTAIGIGIISSLIPAIQAYKTEISATLAHFKT